MTTPSKELHDALGILNRYSDALVKQMADEIIEHAEDFESPGIGQAEPVLEKYALRLHELGRVYSFLRWAAARQNPQAKAPLDKPEF
jgi:hypothetical protein